MGSKTMIIVPYFLFHIYVNTGNIRYICLQTKTNNKTNFDHG
jgi:hypothetical protein